MLWHKVVNQLRPVLHNYLFYVAVLVSILVMIPVYYFDFDSKVSVKEMKAILFDTQSQNDAEKVISSAITSHMANYRPPPPGKFSAADFARFYLEYLNAALHSSDDAREQAVFFVMVRYGVNMPQLKNFIASGQNRQDVSKWLNDHPIWRKKIKIAFKETKTRNLAITLYYQPME